MKKLDPVQIAFAVVNQLSAMIAYWYSNQRCVFSNQAHREWFKKSPEEMVGMSLKELLGPIYEMNLPYIQAALRGEKQVFERQIRTPDGQVRESIATYTPDIVDGIVRGFCAHVCDVTCLREREAALEEAVRARDQSLAEVRVLRGLLPICAHCKSIRNTEGNWQSVEQYVSERSDARFSHGICPFCFQKHYPEYAERTDSK